MREADRIDEVETGARAGKSRGVEDAPVRGEVVRPKCAIRAQEMSDEWADERVRDVRQASSREDRN